MSARVRDLIALSEKRGAPCCSQFLEEGEQLLARGILNAGRENFDFFGGYEGAERKVLCVLPSGIKAEPQDFLIEQLTAEYSEGSGLSHRDFLGSLMALGLKRECIGDIIVKKDCAHLFLTAPAALAAKNELTRVGNAKIALTICEGFSVEFEQEFVESAITVASLRLDCVVAAVSRISREKAADLIRMGRVKVGGILADKCDMRLSDGDKLSIRGEGKFYVGYKDEHTKKQRARLYIKRYV